MNALARSSRPLSRGGMDISPRKRELSVEGPEAPSSSVSPFGESSECARGKTGPLCLPSPCAHRVVGPGGRGRTAGWG